MNELSRIDKAMISIKGIEKDKPLLWQGIDRGTDKRQQCKKVRMLILSHPSAVYVANQSRLQIPWSDFIS